MRNYGRHAVRKPTVLSKLRTAASFGTLSAVAAVVSCASAILGHIADKDSTSSRYIDAV